MRYYTSIQLEIIADDFDKAEAIGEAARFAAERVAGIDEAYLEVVEEAMG